MQRLNLRFRLLPHEPKIVLRLKIDPDLRLSAEDPREPYGHVRRYRRAAIDDRRDVLASHPERIGHPRHRDAKEPGCASDLVVLIIHLVRMIVLESECRAIVLT
jgi:hypothetical protein